MPKRSHEQSKISIPEPDVLKEFQSSTTPWQRKRKILEAAEKKKGREVLLGGTVDSYSFPGLGDVL